MANGKKTRLFKIASEINIGKDAIVDFLVSKGYEIENKSTAVLTPEMTEAVYDKFKKEIKAFEKQQEKFKKHKKFPKKQQEIPPIEFPMETPDDEKPVTKPEPKEAAPPAEPEKKEPIPPEETSEPAVTAPEMKEKTEPVPAEPQRLAAEAKPEAEEETIKEVPKEKEISETQETKETPEETQEPVVTAPEMKEKTEPEPAEPQKPAAEVKVKPASEIKKEVSGADVKKVEEPTEKIKEHEEKPKLEEPEKKEKLPPAAKEDTAEKQEKDAKQKAEDLEKAKHKKRKKQKRLIEIDIDEDAPKLKGLKIVGKIDLVSAEEQKKREKKTTRRKKGKPATEDEAEKAQDKKGAKKPKPREKTESKEKPEKRRRKRRKSIRDTISEEDVDKAIKKTISGMEGTGSSGSRQKYRQKKKEQREEKETKKHEEEENEAKTLTLTEFVTTANLADLMKVQVNDVILKCMELGLMVSINQRLDKDTIQLIADDYGFDVEFHDEKSVSFIEEDEDKPEDLKSRPPIVTIMGHVDHGKTSLLDYIRHSNIVAGEAGGITQHIGAYRVLMDESADEDSTGKNKKKEKNIDSGRSITFLDTPGHEAFTAMRARGAQATDIVILVVAADDSVMPQTVEAISHAEAADVPIIVAINKIDKPDANPDRIKQQLADHNILVEDWGGKYQSVEISAKKGLNIDSLLEKVILEAELLELTANPDRNARGVIVEANMDKGLGPVATIIVQKGTLKIGDAFLAGVHSGKVRAMFDERGKNIKEAGPTIPARVVGFDGLPEAGDILIGLDTETEARNIATERQQLKREQEFRSTRLVTLDDISQQIKEGGVQDLNLIIKADVSGSMEALSDSLLKLSTDEVRVNILHRGVGAINESDVMLALASQAVIVGFQVSVTTQARKLAEKDTVDIRQYNIIYDCINEISLALEGLLMPELKEDITAEIEVRKLFKISRIGTIAGCYVLSGKISRNDKVRVLRDGLPIYTGTIQSLKRGKDDVKEVDTNYECGIQLDGFNDLDTGDIIQGFQVIEVKRQLK